MFELRTPHLVLRDLIDADFALIQQMAREPAVTRYQSYLRLESEEEIRQWLEDLIHYNREQTRRAYNLAVLEQKAPERGIGWIGWGDSGDRRYGDYSFGYALLPAYWGRGYMTEALRAGLAFMFHTLGAEGVTDYCETSNIGSRRVMEKAGMTPVAHWTEESPSGEEVTFVRYAIQRAQWLSQK